MILWNIYWMKSASMPLSHVTKVPSLVWSCLSLHVMTTTFPISYPSNAVSSTFSLQPKLCSCLLCKSVNYLSTSLEKTLLLPTTSLLTVLQSGFCLSTSLKQLTEVNLTATSSDWLFIVFCLCFLYHFKLLTSPFFLKISSLTYWFYDSSPPAPVAYFIFQILYKL